MSIISILCKKNRWKLFLLAAVTESIYISLYFAPTAYHLLYIHYLLVVLLSSFMQWKAVKFLQKQDSGVWFVLFSGLIFRLTLLALPSFTSNDIYRYLWDGKVSTSNINPYNHSPDSVVLLALRDQLIYPNINHSYLPTIYPPVAQFFFYISNLLFGSSVLGFKFLIFLSEILSSLLLLQILQNLRLKQLPSRLATYFWLPLPILEFSIAGHIDAIGVTLLLLAIRLILLEQVKSAAIAFTASILVKVVPIVLLPAIFIRFTFSQTSRFLATSLLTLLVAYFPFCTAGTKMLGSIPIYLDKWSFNSFIFTSIYMLTGSYTVARAACYTLLAFLISIVASTQKEQKIDFVRALFWTLLALMLLSPTLYPWYLTWLAPLLAIIPSRAVFWLVTTVHFSYWSILNFSQGTVFTDPFFVKIVEFLPFFLLLGWEIKHCDGKITKIDYKFLE